MTASLSRPNPFMLVLIAAVLLLGVMGFTYAASNHAETAHVWDAQKIMKCLNDNGPHLKMVFRSKDNKFYLPCLLPDGRAFRDDEVESLEEMLQVFKIRLYHLVALGLGIVIS